MVFPSFTSLKQCRMPLRLISDSLFLYFLRVRKKITYPQRNVQKLYIHHNYSTVLYSSTCKKRIAKHFL